MIGKVQFFFETMDPTHDCEMFLSDDRRKGTESSLKDEYIPAMALKKLLAHTKRRRGLAVEAFVAEGLDVDRYPVPFLQFGDLFTDFLHDTYRFVPYDDVVLGTGDMSFKDVQVAGADG